MALARHPAVQASAVDVLVDSTGSSRLVAWYVRRTGSPIPSSEALLNHLGSLLPRHLVPTDLIAVDSLPRSPNGKLDSKRLPQSSRQERSVERTPDEDLTSTERWICRVWCAVLGRPAVDPDDDFFAIGGTSLSAIQMLARLETALGRKVSVRTLLSASTLRRLAKAIHSSREFELPHSIVPLRHAMAGKPLFCLPGLGGHVFGYRLLLERLPADRPVFGVGTPRRR